MAWDRSKYANAMGSGFVMAGDKKGAVVLTAKHVLDGVRDFQRPEQKHASSALPEFIVPPKISLKPSDLKIVWMGPKTALMMNVVYAFYSKQLDIACCIVTPQKTEKFSPFSVPLDCRTPSVGDTVHMVSCWQNKVSESAPPQKRDGFGQTLEIERAVNIRIGSVTGVYEAGFRQYDFPCFTTSIPAEPGMRGGFVYLPKDGATVAACGIVCGDNPTTEMEDGVRMSQLQSGESVIACTWPTLGLSVPDSIPANDATPKRTIYEMIKTGRMLAYEDSIDLFELIKLEGDDCRVQRKTQQCS